MVDNTRRGLLIGTAFAAALATGCGGDSGGGGGGGGTGGGSNSIDACAIVTQADATQLFGQPAEQDQSSSAPGMLGECVWSHTDADNNSHLLQFSVWKGKGYYNPKPGAQPFAIGDEGAVSSSSLLGIDIDWIQGDRVGALSYFTVGITPDATSKLEEVKTLALAASAKLP